MLPHTSTLARSRRLLPADRPFGTLTATSSLCSTQTRPRPTAHGRSSGSGTGGRHTRGSRTGSGQVSELYGPARHSLGEREAAKARGADGGWLADEFMTLVSTTLRIKRG
ncbi:hypothetical protein GCM10017687_69860 [Streptomyces echinatus]